MNTHQRSSENEKQKSNDPFGYRDERFADIQMLRYKLEGFESLSLQQKIYIFHLSEAALYGRDILFDQNGRHNLRIRKTLEAIFMQGFPREEAEGQALTEYIKQVWFANGIHHHYGCEKFKPQFSSEYLRKRLTDIPENRLPVASGQSKSDFIDEMVTILFDPTVMPKRVNQNDGEDLVLTSACNYYQDVTQQEVENFYKAKKENSSSEQPSWGLNSQLKKKDGIIVEEVWKQGGMYGAAIERIIESLLQARSYAENEKQKELIDLLVEYYRTGNLKTFDDYSIKWISEQEGQIDFINGFIEVYGDPLGLKGSWEALVEYKDEDATKRTRLISREAQWFEEHSPTDIRFKKKTVKGVTAGVVRAAMLGGDEYPLTAIGINLPNAEWIRAKHGSKSVTISNITDAYNKAARGNGFQEEFVIDVQTLRLIERYNDICNDLHTDLHECLGHGSGQLLPDTDPDALKAYGNTIEEARADLFALYYLADGKLVDMGLLPNDEAYKAGYYTYIMNGLMTQLARIAPGKKIEEAHMRNRALIARWVEENGQGIVKRVSKDGKTYVNITDYGKLRKLFARLLAEIQRIKSEGDYEAARLLVENYGVEVENDLHQEVLQRYNRLNLAPYKGFINPILKPRYDENGNITDIETDYSESYAEQMLRYSHQYATL
ncbi:MAG: dihydrofolate reductase [Prevotella sp.]|nr:dihydrofolate reductase [Prevotella sp.]